MSQGLFSSPLVSDSLFILPQDSSIHFSESILDYIDLFHLLMDSIPEEDFGLNPYLLPPVFDGKFLEEMTIQLPPPLKEHHPLSIPLDTLSLHSKGKQYVDRLRKKSFHYLLFNHIELIKYTKSALPQEVEKIAEMKPDPNLPILKINYIPESENVGMPAIFKPKSIYWQRSGNSLIQFSQTHLSDNWYKGGTGNLNLLSVQNYTANYKKGRMQFNNFVEWKLSFYTNPNDTLRSFRIGDDLIRYYGDFGIRAFNNKWFYSTNVEIKTQLFNNYKENTRDIATSFLSPVMLNVGLLGMKYQLEKLFPKNKYKKLNLSADISLLSIQYTHVMNKDIDPARFGTENGKRYLMDFGSTINAKLIINFNREISLSSRFKLFSNYEKTIIESENELNISLNRYFSTRFYFYPRFDDSPGLVKDDRFGYVQFNELLSFGFNFKW
ncbi:MAG: DUF3078 domain-containing protein [Dysgonamonadaceae bacterium]|nr:DUF3078 domain-containing protein [Dysgonamonadaceae bacterium]